VDTMRLRTIQSPNRVEKLLEALISSANLLPAGCYRVHTRSALGPRLYQLSLKAAKEDKVWSGWSDDRHLWLVTGEMSLELSRERGAPVLQVNVYGEDTGLQDSGQWFADREGRWHRTTD
jgi:hypothetical protein